MKNYAETLNEKHTPMTAEELDELAFGSVIDHARYMRLVGEVKHLRRMMAIAYHWIGRKAPANTTMNRDYMAALKEAARIRKEDE